MRYLRLSALLAIVAAASSLTAACGSDSPPESHDGAPEELEAPPFKGQWTVNAGGHYVTIHVEGGSAKVVDFVRYLPPPIASFKRDAIGNPEVFDAESTYLRNIDKVSPGRMRAQYAQVTYNDALTPWPVKASFRDVELTYDGAGWVSEAESLAIYLASETFSEVERAGACEYTFVNIYDQRGYSCYSPTLASDCDIFEEVHFWPTTTCKRLGYTVKEPSDDDLIVHEYFESPEGGLVPGAYGQWGDGSGTTPMPTPEATEGGGTGGGGSGASCLEGTWGEDPADCPGRPITLSFQGGSGKFTNPDCTGQCNPITFPYTYTVSGDSVTLHYSSPPNVVCGGESHPIDKPTDDSFTFTCSGDTLTTTTTLGTSTYKRM